MPWLDWVAWQEVLVGLFSTDSFAQQQSVSRVAAWRSRAQLPVAINATAQLIELQLHETLAQHHHHAVGVSSRSHMELTLLYANVIVRCVNGLVDGSQKGAYALAVSTLAQRIGIPLWVVDLRHESTHNQLPSLPVLRFAARHLLAWLRANYWNAQESLIQGQVHQVAQWLFQQLPHLVQTLGNSKESTQKACNLVLDADTLRNVVIPLLVDGKQYSERVARTGLLFLGFLPPKKQNAMTIFQKEAFIALFLNLQPIWRSFSASLLAKLCWKVFKAICPQNSCRTRLNEADQVMETEDDEVHGQNEVDMTLLWIKFMVSSEYRERLKLQITPVEDLCQCGAEMLVLGEEMKAQDAANIRTDLLNRLLSALRSSKGIRNHSTLAIEAAIVTISVENSKEGWVELPAWVISPLGLRYGYTCHNFPSQRQLCEYSLDDDILMPDSTTFVANDDEESDLNIINDVDAELAMDALMEDWDMAYDTAIQHTLELQATIAREGLRQGDSTTVLPKQELQRIQEEIEIW